MHLESCGTDSVESLAMHPSGILRALPSTNSGSLVSEPPTSNSSPCPPPETYSSSFGRRPHEVPGGVTHVTPGGPVSSPGPHQSKVGELPIYVREPIYVTRVTTTPTFPNPLVPGPSPRDGESLFPNLPLIGPPVRPRDPRTRPDTREESPFPTSSVLEGEGRSWG